MNKFLIVSQVLVFLHISFGELAGASLLWSVKELIYLSTDHVKWLKRSLWLAFGSVMCAWVAGGSYYLFYYPKVKPVILAGPESWAHSLFTESKEHIFLALPVLIFFLAMFAQKRARVLLENKSVRNKFLALTLFTTALVFSMALMGYMITWGARTALWVNSGL